MLLRRLELRNFRNFVDETVEFPEGGIALIGDNGQGKTNLLESVYYLEIFRSFRGARDEQLIAWGSPHFRIEAQLQGDGSGEALGLAAGYVREGRRKKVTVGGREPERMAEAIGRVGAIVFTASDIEIVTGAPGVRRRFLDIVLSLVEPGYLAALQRYRSVLAQRNAALRDGGSAAELAAWNEGLVAAGSQIVAGRARWVLEKRASFSRYYAAISGGQAAGFDYLPSVPAPDEGGDGLAEVVGAWARSFQLQLERMAARERRRGTTLVGPHRDDLRLGMAGGSESVLMRSFGSAGQQRSAAVALRMVEAETLRAAQGRRPIVMLDDVFAELDPLRAERVAELLRAEAWGQVIVTSPKPSEFAFLGGALAEYRICDGAVRPA